MNMFCSTIICHPRPPTPPVRNRRNSSRNSGVEKWSHGYGRMIASKKAMPLMFLSCRMA